MNGLEFKLTKGDFFNLIDFSFASNVGIPALSSKSPPKFGAQIEGPSQSPDLGRQITTSTQNFASLLKIQKYFEH